MKRGSLVTNALRNAKCALNVLKRVDRACCGFHRLGWRYPESLCKHETEFARPLGLGWRECPHEVTDILTKHALDIIHFVIQSEADSGQCWKAKIVQENSHSWP